MNTNFNKKLISLALAGVLINNVAIAIDLSAMDRSFSDIVKHLQEAITLN